MDAVRLSGELFDVMTERPGPTLYDNRRNCGVGRGLEFWRVLRRDFGTFSSEARLAKLRSYTTPQACTRMADLGTALDKWESLGRELPDVPSEFRLIGLKALVPPLVEGLKL